MPITNIIIHIVPLEEAKNESSRRGSDHAYSFEELVSYINQPRETSIYYYSDDDSTEEIFKQLKKTLPAGNELHMGFNTLKVNKKFVGRPANKSTKKVVEKEWKDSGKQKLEKLFKERQKTQKPKLKVLKSQIISALEKVLEI